LVRGLHEINWKDVPIIAAETFGAESFHNSVKAGKIVPLKEVTSICTTLGAKTICKEVFEASKKHPIISVVLSDDDAVDACLNFVNDAKVLVEPSCGVGIATIYKKIPQIMDIIKDKENPVVVMIVCGGNSLSIEDLQNHQKKKDKINK